MVAASFKHSIVILSALAVLASGKPIRKPAAADAPACTDANTGAWACTPDRAQCYAGAWHNTPCDGGTVCQDGACVFPSGGGGGGGGGSSSSSKVAGSTSAKTLTTDTKTTATDAKTTATDAKTTATDSKTTTADSKTKTTSDPSPTSKPPPPSKGAKFVTYIDSTAGSSGPAVFAIPGSVSKNAYNIVNLAFWQSFGPWDTANVWSKLDSSTRQGYVDAYHKAGIKVLVSAFGAAEWPTTAGTSATKSADDLAAFIKDNQLDGADIDWEDNNAMSAGTGEKWLIDFTKQLRKQLPKPYIISHAPQAPYFIDDKKIYPNGGYLAVDKEVGDMIDFYNVQFYNQGDSKYDSCKTLLDNSGGSFSGTSLFEIIANGIDSSKLIIGKPVTQAGASNTGFMDVKSLEGCVSEAHKKGWNGGVMGWQFTLDDGGSWINQLASAME